MAAGKWNMQKASGGVASITVADGVGATNIVLPESGTVATTSNIVGFKNYIINGGFGIWQRGTSFSAVGYCADRWHLAIGGSANVIKHNTVPNTILVSTTASSSFANLYQAIEAATVIGLRGKTLTLSLKLQTVGTHMGGFVLSARYSNSTDTLNSQTTTIQSLGISASSTNTRYSLTFTVPADAVGLRIDIENTSVQPSGALYQVQEVQLEEGSVATPFEQRPIGLELSLCRRYYTQAGAGATGIEETASMVSFGIKFDTPMRTPPTIVVNPTVSLRLAGVDRLNISVSVAGETTISDSGIWLHLIDNSNGSVAGRPIINRTATNFIIASAEL